MITPALSRLRKWKEGAKNYGGTELGSEERKKNSKQVKRKSALSPKGVRMCTLRISLDDAVCLDLYDDSWVVGVVIRIFGDAVIL